MEVVTDRKDGLFPLPGEMSFHCSCPDWAVMCKHVAAVLYGVGARLDSKPELLFTLRGVEPRGTDRGRRRKGRGRGHVARQVEAAGGTADSATSSASTLKPARPPLHRTTAAHAEPSPAAAKKPRAKRGSGNSTKRATAQPAKLSRKPAPSVSAARSTAKAKRVVGKKAKPKPSPSRAKGGEPC